MSDGAAPARRDSFYGRRKGHALRAGQATILDQQFERLGLDLTVPAPANLAALFDASVTDVALEIGFGGGEHLVHRAESEPGTGRIGVEPFVNGMAKATSKIASLGLANIRLFDRDAAELLDWLPAASLSAVDLLYPDPWPKPRHFKRRFVSDRNIERIARVLRPGAPFRFASDIDSYVEWTLLHLARHASFAWTARDADDWRLPFAGWPGTRYEQKAIREGRRGTYLTFRRL